MALGLKTRSGILIIIHMNPFIIFIFKYRAVLGITNEGLAIIFLTLLCFTYCRVHSDYTKLQNRQCGSGHNLRNFPCVSSAAGSCLPPATGSRQTSGSAMSSYQPTSTPTKPQSPASLHIFIYCICRWTCLLYLWGLPVWEKNTNTHTGTQ